MTILEYCKNLLKAADHTRDIGIRTGVMPPDCPALMLELRNAVSIAEEETAGRAELEAENARLRKAQKELLDASANADETYRKDYRHPEDGCPDSDRMRREVHAAMCRLRAALAALRPAGMPGEGEGR